MENKETSRDITMELAGIMMGTGGAPCPLCPYTHGSHSPTCLVHRAGAIAKEEQIFSQAWEEINPGTDRLEVPGGWLVIAPSGALAFVPDPQKHWNLAGKDG